jgi:ubiquinone/menaquinone biosynthesis C-methylase UbiE
MTYALAERFGDVVGLDVSPEMVRQAARHAPANCRFLVHGSAPLPFADESFDLVLSMLVLQHIPSRRVRLELLAEFVRVLRPDGLAIIQVPAHVPLRHRLQPRARLYGLLRSAIPANVLYAVGMHPIRMCAVEPERIAGIAQILRVSDDPAPRTYWLGRREK